MSLQPTPQQQQVMAETQRVATIAEFEQLRAASKPEMDKALAKIEVQTYNQPIDDSLITMRRIYLRVVENIDILGTKNYTKQDRIFLQDAIRMLSTAQYWFSEGLREGNWRPRASKDMIEASKTWRKTLKHMGEAAFSYDPETAKKFADVNTTRTTEEEVSDLRTLLSLLEEFKDELTAVGLTPALTEQGQALLQEAEGYDLLKALGLSSQEEAFALRNRLLTYAVVLGRKALNFGKFALLEDPEKLALFQGLSLADALRRIQERKVSPAKTEEEPPQTPNLPS